MVISSLVVEAAPDKLDSAAKELAAIPGVEVHGVQDYKIVVTLEAETSVESHDIAATFMDIDGVFGVNLIYFNFEDDPTIYGKDDGEWGRRSSASS